jgi:hypothetical protein
MLKYGSLGVLLGLPLFFSYGSAAPTSTTTVVAPSLPDQKSQRRPYQLSFAIESFSYFSETKNLLNLRENETVVRGAYYDSFAKNFSAGLDLRYGAYPRNNFTFFAAPEAFLQVYTAERDLELTLGRKVMAFSELDEYFNLGLYQPYLTQDFLRFDRQGLPGLSGRWQGANWSLRAGWQMLYAPNQTPVVREVDGEIITANRWVRRPPTRYSITDGNENAITYVLEEYKASDLALNQGAHARLQLGAVAEEPVLSFTYSRQPLNDIVLARELDIRASRSNKAHVFLRPQVVYTQLFSADIRYDSNGAFKARSATDRGHSFETASEGRANNWGIFASYIQDQPENERAPEYYTIQTLEPMHGVGAGLDFQTTLPPRAWLAGFVDEVAADIGWAQFSGGEIRDLKADGSTDPITLSQQRLQFMQPWRMGFKSVSHLSAGSALESHWRFTYDERQKGSIFSMRWAYVRQSGLQLDLGADVLGKVEETLEDGLFIDQFKSNDRVFGGMSYVF